MENVNYKHSQLLNIPPQDQTMDIVCAKLRPTFKNLGGSYAPPCVKLRPTISIFSSVIYDMKSYAYYLLVTSIIRTHV